MDKFIEKISSYNLFNNLFPGATFCFLIYKLCGINLTADNIVESILIYYFVGLVISRTGSIVVEPLFKKIKIINFIKYNDYVNASKKDNKIDILSESNNIYRTMIALCLLLALAKFISYLYNWFDWFKVCYPWIILVLLTILFSLAYKKQTNYIKKRAAVVNHDQD